MRLPSRARPAEAGIGHALHFISRRMINDW